MADTRSGSVRQDDDPLRPPMIQIPRNKGKVTTNIKLTKDNAVCIEKLAVGINPVTKVIVPTFVITTDARGEPYDIVSLCKYLDTAPDSVEYINYRKADEIKVEKSANIQTGLAGAHQFDYAYDQNGTRVKKTQGIYIKKFEPAEKLSSDIINELFPGMGASVLRIRCDAERFDGSIMFPEYQPGYVVLHEQYNAIQTNKNNKVDIPTSRPKQAGTRWPHIIKGGLCYEENGELKPYYPGLFEIWANSIFRGDFDPHWANLVLVQVSNKNSSSIGRGAIIALDKKNENSRKEWRHFDFGWGYHKTASSLENYYDPITEEDFKCVAHLHILSHTRHMIPGKPTNHFTEIPKKLLFTEPFALALDHIANHDFDTLKKIIERNVKDISTDKGIVGLRQFAKHIDFEIKNEEKAEKELITKLCAIHKARQGMCRELAFSIRLSQCIEKKEKVKEYTINKEKFIKLLKDHPAYAIYIDYYIESQNAFHFRGREGFKKCAETLSDKIKVTYQSLNKDNVLTNAGIRKAVEMGLRTSPLISPSLSNPAISSPPVLGAVTPKSKPPQPLYPRGSPRAPKTFFSSGSVRSQSVGSKIPPPLPTGRRSMPSLTSPPPVSLEPNTSSLPERPSRPPPVPPTVLSGRRQRSTSNN